MKIYLSESANKALASYLLSEGHSIEAVSAGFGGAPLLDPAIAAHPDVYMCKLGASDEAPVFKGRAELLEPLYPKDCLFNAAVFGSFVVCRRKSISQELLSAAEEYIGAGAEIIDVPQGYAKCNIAVLDGSHVITEDEGIYKRLSALPGIECLKVKGGFVALPGYRYGFIGGCCGRVGSELIFNGDVSLHPDFESIKNFAHGCGLEIKGFDGILTDIGSIISEK